jgi:murein DD-endopeptidase MepM/ murein hydrolase activator NlpD
MLRRFLLLGLLSLFVVTPAGGAPSTLRDRQDRINDKIAALRDKINAASEKEEILTSEIAAVTARIRGLEDDVTRANARLDTLEHELALYRNRLAILTQIYEAQTEKLNLLRRQFVVAERRLHRRLVSLYQQEDPTAVDVVLAARSFTEMLDQLDYLNEIAGQDLSIARQVAAAKKRVTAERVRTNTLRTRVRRTAAAVQVRVDAQVAERDRLRANQDALADARSVKQQSLDHVAHSKEEFLEEVRGLEKVSAQLAARIRSAQTASYSAVAPSAGVASSSGFIWPVSGTLTSSFGWRWGRMHEGIDIAAPGGAPIAAAASGVVIYAGWMGGYGNLVVIDHGGGIATAYAHQSSIAVGNGAPVAQGQVIGYVGSTGHSTGNHLHFEVRVNGAAVDPLGYL